MKCDSDNLQAAKAAAIALVDAHLANAYAKGFWFAGRCFALQESDQLHYLQLWLLHLRGELRYPQPIAAHGGEPPYLLRSWLQADVFLRAATHGFIRPHRTAGEWKALIQATLGAAELAALIDLVHVG